MGAREDSVPGVPLLWIQGDVDHCTASATDVAACGAIAKDGHCLLVDLSTTSTLRPKPGLLYTA